MLSALAGISPRLVGELYEICKRQTYKSAYSLQEDAAILFRALRDAGRAGP